MSSNTKFSFEVILKLIKEEKILISSHARLRMFERNISTDEIIKTIENGEIIETYLEDTPCPSVLVFSKINNKPIHVVIAQCQDHVRVVTTYEPEDDKWIDFRTRR